MPRLVLCLTAIVLSLAFSGARAGDAKDSMSWTTTSSDGAFEATLTTGEHPVPVGRFHEWTVQIIDASGQPVHPATVTIDGGMPGHGHGMPSAPQVTGHLGDGVYRVEGMKFNMAGAWMLAVTVANDAINDRAEFAIKLTP